MSLPAISFDSPDPDFESRVRSSFSRQGIMRYLEAELTADRAGQCEVRLPYKPELSQQHGYFHGGVIGTIADSAGGYAAFTLMPADSGVLTVEYKLNLLAPGDGDLLIARGEVIRPGRSLMVSRADVVARKHGRDRLCATLLQTLITMRGKPELQG